LAGVFLAGFLVFFGLAVTLFMMGFRVKDSNGIRLAGEHRLLLRYETASKVYKCLFNGASGSPPDAHFDQRIRFDGVALSLSGSEGQEAVACANVDDALAHIRAQPKGRLLVRGSNGSGKSTLLVALKARLGPRAFYWPTSDKLAFAFSGAPADEGDEASSANGYSSGEQQLESLWEIVSRTHAAVYLLDEWDANLDTKNRASAEALVALLAARAVVVEISYRDRVQAAVKT